MAGVLGMCVEGANWSFVSLRLLRCLMTLYMRMALLRVHKIFKVEFRLVWRIHLERSYEVLKKCASPFKKINKIVDSCIVKPKTCGITGLVVTNVDEWAGESV